MKNLLAVGACCFDTILDVDHFPSEDEKLSTSKLTRRRGGNTPNTLNVLQHLLDADQVDSQLTLSLCAVLPSRSSIQCQELQSTFAPSIDLSRCIFREDHVDPVSSYIIRSGDARTIINHNVLPGMSSEEVMQTVKSLENLHWCHFEGRNVQVCLESIPHLRSLCPGVTISVEVEKPRREGLESLAALADVVFYSRSWAEHKGYKSAAECVRAQSRFTPHATLLICTWGASGASTLEKPSMKLIERAAFNAPRKPVVDTVGAGDTFIAGVLFGLICRSKEWNLEQTLKFANELAGTKVAQEGFDGLGELMAPALIDRRP